MNRLKAILVAIALLLAFTGCGGAQSVDIRMDLSAKVQNLDPQFATDPVAQMFLANTMEGLMARQPDGTLATAAAESYTISPSGLKYTFTLRKGLKWSDGSDLVAEDFAFALTRLFHWQVPSPYAERFSMIQNAPEVLKNELPVSALGINAPDDRTLEITLSRRSPRFLELLCETAALPCSKAFFESTRARYGLGAEYTLANGPFYLHLWDNGSRLILRPNGQYREPTTCSGLIAYTTRLVTPDSQIELFTEGKSDICSIADKDLGKLPDGATTLEMENKVWQLVMNTADQPLDDRDLRRALAMSLERDSLLERVPSIYGLADSLVPPSARSPGFLLPELLPYNAQWAKDSAEKAFLHAGIDRSVSLTVLLPADAGLEQMAAYMQKQWRDTLGVYVNMETLPMDELQKKLDTGKFDMAVLLMESGGQSTARALEKFLAKSSYNYSRLDDPELDALILQAADAGDDRQAAGQYARAEQFIIDSAAAVPLLNQSGYLAFSSGTTGVELRDGMLIFKDATRIE